MPRLGGNSNSSGHRANHSSSNRPNTQSSQNPPPNAKEIINHISSELDEKLFNPWYETESSSSEIEKALTSKFSDYKSFSKIEETLRLIKVGSIVGFLICSGLALSNLFSGRAVHAIFYMILSHDLLKVSYNCYIRKYCSNACKRLGVNFIQAAANTLFNVINSAIFGKPDVVTKLQEEIMLDVLLDYTLTQKGIDLIKRNTEKIKSD